MPPRLDPNTNTREEFTRAALQQPIPDDADPKWKELNQAIKDLMLKLLEHDAMRVNKTQPFMTPAANKNRVYFLWDSTSRLLPNLYSVPWQLQASEYWDSNFQATWSIECVAKSKQVASLMVDGAQEGPFAKIVNQMISSPGSEAPMGDDITQLAQRIIDM